VAKGFPVAVEARKFISFTVPITVLGFEEQKDTKKYFPGVKRPEGEANR
jgi:hypothetical protein